MGSSSQATTHNLEVVSELEIPNVEGHEPFVFMFGSCLLAIVQFDCLCQICFDYDITVVAPYVCITIGTKRLFKLPRLHF